MTYLQKLQKHDLELICEKVLGTPKPNSIIATSDRGLVVSTKTCSILFTENDIIQSCVSVLTNENEFNVTFGKSFKIDDIESNFLIDVLVEYTLRKLK